MLAQCEQEVNEMRVLRNRMLLSALGLACVIASASADQLVFWNFNPDCVGYRNCGLAVVASAERLNQHALRFT